jgi:hypothetical protein
VKDGRKEIDYVYLGLAAVDVVTAANELPLLHGNNVPNLNLITPMFLTAAIVVRAIKTRVEVAGWNTRKFHGLPPP